MMDGERLAQLLRLRIGIKPQGVHRCGSHRFQRAPAQLSVFLPGFRW
jgi:hypothetical protein